uniref:Nucleoside diphosphate kinase-like domain-containing protein n=1 Tax=Plectus sambesii TaxID=2011161 RepID=A0A914V7K4_9BILA
MLQIENEKLLERTFALIKPDAFHDHELILDEINQEGFKIIEKRHIILSLDKCADFFLNRANDDNFDELMSYMTSGPIIAMVLSKRQAISDWLTLMGPESAASNKLHRDCLRARYGHSEFRNGFYGSEDFASAERDISFFFSHLEEQALTDQMREYLTREVNPILSHGLTELCRAKPEDPILWLADWLRDNRPS